MTIEEILAGESKNVEFKENLPEKSIKYMKSVVAFANGTGGKIIFGIADKTREVVGFDKEDVFKKMDAIRELIINAMVHRSYLDHGTIQVAVYDNRLEITSPGKLPMGQTMERMKEGYSKIRNKALAHAFAYMNLIEHWGSGIPRIIDKVKASGLQEPEFIVAKWICVSIFIEVRLIPITPLTPMALKMALMALNVAPIMALMALKCRLIRNRRR